MKISKTYQVITPESAEHGETAESGFEWAGYDMTPDELIRDMTVYVEPSEYPLRKVTRHTWFTSSDPDRDYSDCSDTYHSWHIDEATDLELKKLFILLKRAGR